MTALEKPRSWTPVPIFDEHAELVELADGRHVPRTFGLRADYDDGYVVTIRCAVTESKQPVVREVTLTGRSVTANDLRAVRLAHLRDTALKIVAAWSRSIVDDDGNVVPGHGEIDQAIRRAASEHHRTVTDTLLVDVAELVKQVGRGAAREVMNKYGVSLSTARRYIARAKKRGFLK